MLDRRQEMWILSRLSHIGVKTFSWQQVYFSWKPSELKVPQFYRRSPESWNLEAKRALANIPGFVRGSRCWTPYLATYMNDYPLDAELSPFLIPHIHLVMKHSWSFANRIIIACPLLFLSIATVLTIILISSFLDFCNGISASLYFTSLPWNTSYWLV